MRELSDPNEWIAIKDRGEMACYSSRKWDPIPRVGEHIIIVGAEFEITGIEQFAILSAGTDAYWDDPRPGNFLVKRISHNQTFAP